MDKQAIKICSVPGCGKPMRAKKLCNPHYMRKLYGVTMQQMIADMDKPPSIGSGRPINIRLSEEAKARLKASCAKLGFPSVYKLASHIVETWNPKK